MKSILFNEMDKRYVEPGTPGAKRGKRGGWYVEEPSKEPIKDKKGDIGIKVNHPRFGKGTITNIDRTTYSIPMVTVKLDSGDEIVRSINEWKKEPAGKEPKGKDDNADNGLKKFDTSDKGARQYMLDNYGAIPDFDWNDNDKHTVNKMVDTGTTMMGGGRSSDEVVEELISGNNNVSDAEWEEIQFELDVEPEDEEPKVKEPDFDALSSQEEPKRKKDKRIIVDKTGQPIAKAHLMEDELYYTHLLEMEKKYEQQGNPPERTIPPTGVKISGDPEIFSRMQRESLLFKFMDFKEYKKYVKAGTPGAKRGKRGGWYIETEPGRQISDEVKPWKPKGIKKQISDKELYKAEFEGLLPRLYEEYELSPKQIDYALDIDKALAQLYQYQELSPENIDKALENDISELYWLYNNNKLSPEQLDKALEKNKFVDTIYNTQVFTPEQIDKEIDKDNDRLWNIYRRQKLSPEQVDKAIDKGEYLDYLYEYQDLSPEQLDNAIDKGKNLEKLYRHQELSSEQIDKVMDELSYHDLVQIYKYQKLSPEQVDKAIDKGEYLDYLYEYQDLSPEQLDNAIDKGGVAGLYYLYAVKKLSPEQVDKAIDRGEHLNYLYEHQDLTPEQLDKAMDKGKNLEELYIHQKLLPEQIDKAIDKDKHLHILYNNQDLTPEQIDKAMEKGEALSVLYDKQNLSPEQIDKAFEKGSEGFELCSFFTKKLSPKSIDKAIEKGKELGRLYKHQKMSPESIDKAIEKGKELGRLYEYQKLSPESIDKAIDKSEYMELNYLFEHQKLTPENINKAIDNGEQISHLCEHQKFSPENIDRAIDKGDRESMYSLYNNNKLSSKQIDKAIENGRDLHYIYGNQKMSEKQINTMIDKAISTKSGAVFDILSERYKDEVLKKLNIDTESKLYKSVRPNLIIPTKLEMDKAIKEKLPEKPLKKLTGKYKVDTTDIGKSILDEKPEIKNRDGNTIISKEDYQKVEDVIEKNKIKVSDDLKYIIRDDGSKMSFGKLINKSGDENLVKKFNMMRQFQQKEGDNNEIVISMDPEDIAMKSTGQNWTSCESIGDMYGNPGSGHCGWSDDIRLNSAIGYIKNKDTGDWIGRVMIRWGKDKKGETNAVVEKYYGDVSYREILSNSATKILRANGYSGEVGTGDNRKEDNSFNLQGDYSGYQDFGNGDTYYTDKKPDEEEMKKLQKSIRKIERMMRMMRMTEKKNIELLKVGRDVPLNPLSKRQIQKLVDSNLQIYKKYKRKTESLLFNFVNR